MRDWVSSKPGIRFERKIVHVKRCGQFLLLLVHLAEVVAHWSVLSELPGRVQVALCPCQIAHLEVDPAERVPVSTDRQRKL